MDCGTPSPTPYAYYCPASSSWRTWPPSAHEDSTAYSGTWPRSGTTQHGHAFAPATLEPVTAASVSSSLLPTPTARDHHGAASPKARKAGGHQLNLPDVACAYLLPTPAACNPNDGESPETWLERRARQQPHRAMPLAIAVKLLPTPRASDTGTAGRQPGEGFRPPLSAVLLPTPKACDGTKGYQTQTDSKGHPTLPGIASRIGAPTNPLSAAGKNSSDDLLPTRPSWVSEANPD